MSQDTLARVRRITDVCASATRDRGDLTSALSDVARLESWAAARRAQLVSALKEQPGAFPEADIADTTGTTLGAATRETERAATLDAAESFADALDHGEIRPGHVDALTRTTKNLTDEQAAQLLDHEGQLAASATHMSIREFEQHLARESKKLERESDAEERLDRQRRNTRLSTWVDQGSGMWKLRGQFDPDLGRRLQRVLDETVGSLFAEQTPDTAPSDPVERTQHLAALALAQLVEGTGSGRNRPGAPIVVVDATAATTANAAPSTSGVTTGAGHLTAPDAAPIGPSVDWGIPVELPFSVLRDVFGAHDPDVVIVANGVVLHAPGTLDLGRTTRLANRAQRRALRGLYAGCAVPGCSVHYDRCRLHHVVWWRNGGCTDLDNLLPLCQHHHTRLHEDSWEVTLGPNRELTIGLPSGKTLGTGPPKRSAA